MIPQVINISILIILCLFTNINAQGQWEWSNPQPSGHDILDIHFFNSNDGIALNNAGEILFTNDCGKKWNIKNTLSSGNDMDCLNSTCVVVGNYGLIYKTTDSGKNWIDISLHFEADKSEEEELLQVEILSKDTILIIGDYIKWYNSYNLYKTVNGGDDWSKIQLPEYVIRDVAFINSLYGYAICFDGKIIKTENGGLDWTEVFQCDYGVDVYGGIIHFINDSDSIGFTSTSDYSGSMYKTTDGGASWFNIQNSPYLKSICFTNDTLGYAIKESGVVVKSTDQGITWRNIYNEISAESDFNTLYFLNDSNGFIGGLYGRLLQTLDGGNTWTPYSPTYNDIRKVNFPVDSIGYAIDDSNRILKTSDHGKSWSHIYTYDRASLNDIYFIDNDTGLIVGAQRTILRTTDGGLNWTRTLTGGLAANYRCIDFLDNATGFISSTGSNSLKKTNDAGLSWTNISGYGFYELQFINDSVGYARSYATLYKTINGGIDWTKYYQGDITSLSFLSDSIGFISGDDGLLLKTIDGGENWQELQFDEFYELNFKDVHFYNSMIGYVTGEKFYEVMIYKTIDGGTSWTREDMPDIKDSDPFGLLSFSHTANNDIFLSGSNGVILHSSISDSLITFTKSQIINCTSNDCGIEIYPNPTSDKITINSEQSICEVRITNLKGQIRKTVINNNIIDLSDYSPGLYFINIVLSDSVKSFKIIKN